MRCLQMMNKVEMDSFFFVIWMHVMSRTHENMMEDDEPLESRP